MSSPETISFTDLALSAPVLKAVQNVGYEQPSPIQAASIPHLLNGEDLLGVAQTGTGKTAAFALPLLSNIDVKNKVPQVLVLAPTRELAIQVAEAFKSYACEMKGFQVLPIYGGQDMRGQLKQLERGPQVVVGTPGRVMDHLRRGSLKLGALKCVVLDEADEMLRMGFIDDVEWILEHTPKERQVALFSATMPAPIKKVADTYLRNPKEVRIASATQTGSHIKQSYLIVNGFERKLDAITRILEAHDFDAMIIFVRTKTATAELAEKLEARGYSAAALNGDMNQQLRERTISRLKNKQLDIVVATDVAARGIDVERVSHVLNFDIPYDSEAYVHRIGRTGRAGRNGSAILFVAPREKRLLFSIEKNTRQKIEPMELPSGKEVSSRRVEQFKQLLTDTLASQPNLDYFFQILSEYSTEHDCSAEDIACALAYLHQLERPLEVKDNQKGRQEKGFTNVEENRQSRTGDSDQMMRYRIELGRDQQVGPGDIVGALMNETDLHKNDIGHIKLNDDHSTVDLPLALPKELVAKLKTLTVRNLPINISEVGPAKREQRQPGKRSGAPGANNKAPRKKPRKAKKD
ncbi:DEAD/DEAH box helicase [Dasania marina]|uniref:DEAD/DEAH box helicase n=1 Tax=Dasania marina TaxID=471499 RepID=UPI000362FF10|nr:DEAD/DEAH box helicase [Dasania marina]